MDWQLPDIGKPITNNISVYNGVRALRVQRNSEALEGTWQSMVYMSVTVIISSCELIRNCAIRNTANNYNSSL